VIDLERVRRAENEGGRIDGQHIIHRRPSLGRTHVRRTARSAASDPTDQPVPRRWLSLQAQRS
jgi:hypothetical protein